MALCEVRAPPFYRGNWQGDIFINYLFLSPTQIKDQDAATSPGSGGQSGYEPQRI